MSECYFCGEDKTEVLDEHHVVPDKIVTCEREAQREDIDKTIMLCANCHRKMHHLLDYIIQFYSDKMQRRPSTDGFNQASDLNNND